VQWGRLVVGFAWMPEDGGGWQGTGSRPSARGWRGYVPWKQPVGRHAAPRRLLRADTAVLRARLDDILGSDRQDERLRSPDVGE
jgi:hypothetical protein